MTEKLNSGTAGDEIENLDGTLLLYGDADRMVPSYVAFAPRHKKPQPPVDDATVKP